MPEPLPVLRSKQVASALVRAGFVLIRQKGSHAQYRKGTLTVTVPMHSGDVALGTMKSILRQARMTSDEFKNFL
jgi:predicted RNA binding protein YcfA (HicA-like mRNA interferase family)